MSNPLFDPERYQAVRKPLLEAATLPPACYTSTEFFEREIERVFLRNWQFVGREEQLEAPGVLLLRGAGRVGDYHAHG
jgi:hypothetical protein